MKKIIVLCISLFASVTANAEAQLGRPLECANAICGKQMNCNKVACGRNGCRPGSGCMVFGGVAKMPDPRIAAAKKASWNLLQNHLVTRRPAELVSIKLLQQSGDFFLTQVLVDSDGDNQIRTRQSYCLVLEVTMIADEIKSTLAPVVTVVDNNNDVKNLFIQECANPPTEQDFNRLKLLNDWPGIRDTLSLDEQKSLAESIPKLDNLK